MQELYKGHVYSIRRDGLVSYATLIYAPNGKSYTGMFSDGYGELGLADILDWLIVKAKKDAATNQPDS